MNTRTELLNYIIRKHGLKSYLEIGLQSAVNNFNHIQCVEKSSVDPDPVARAQYVGTSDKYFEAYAKLGNPVGIDIVFIDGLHHADQVVKDIRNSLRLLRPKFIVLHDCWPDGEQYTTVPRQTKRWFGDVYKVAANLGKNPRLFCTVSIDCGCGVLKAQDVVGINTWGESFITYKELTPEAVNLKTVEQFQAWI